MKQKPSKIILQGGAVFNAQYNMCDLIYRKINELMISTGENYVDVKFTLDLKIRIHFNIDFNFIFYFNTIKDGKRYETIGELNLKKINTSSNITIDPVFAFCKEFQTEKNDIPTIYSNWFNELKKTIQILIDKENKYYEIVNEINSLPFFSPTREVIFEKTIN